MAHGRVIRRKFQSLQSNGVESSWIGIPNPVWGNHDIVNMQAPPAPENWSSEVAGYYYVNYATGTDTGRTYGTPAAPRRTIPAMLPAGSRVQMAPGVAYSYTSAGVIRLGAAGTGDAWVANTTGPAWIVGDIGNKPIFSGYMTLLYGAYLFVDGCKFDEAATNTTVQVASYSAQYDAHHIALRNSEIAGNNSSGYGFSVVTGITTPSNNIAIIGCALHDFGPSYDVDLDAHMINTAASVNNVWVLGNTLTNSSGSGIQVLGSSNSTAPCEYVYIAGNTVDNARQAGIWVKSGRHVIISQNVVRNIQDRMEGTGTSPSKGLGGQYYPDKVWWLFNDVSNCRYGIRVPSTTSFGVDGEYYAIGNIIRGCHKAPATGSGGSFGYPSGTNTWDQAGIHFVGGSIRQAIGNTIVQSTSGIHISGAANGTTIENNIIYDQMHENGYHIFLESASGAWTFKNNLCHLKTGANSARTGNTNITTIADLQAAYPSYCADNHETDPLFTSPSTNDFTIKNTSPAKNLGSASSAYDTFFALYGIDIKKDYAGNTRPQGGTWDIGAYERVG